MQVELRQDTDHLSNCLFVKEKDKKAVTGVLKLPSVAYYSLYRKVAAANRF